MVETTGDDRPISSNTAPLKPVLGKEERVGRGRSVSSSNSSTVTLGGMALVEEDDGVSRISRYSAFLGHSGALNAMVSFFLLMSVRQAITRTVKGVLAFRSQHHGSDPPG